MFPPVYQTLRANATVLALVGESIGMNMPAETPPPYVTWFIVTGQPHDTLSEAPQSDFTSVQIDCYSGPTAERTVRDLAEAVRAALDSAGVHNRVVVNLREPDTKFYRVGIEADFITQR
ncbi:DUF3168 domain-containing protein [Marilutibacter spongiae]|uniref:DUF3168 domain-containing protein n=1 Tax=Marilutibacter spongiae TaxID=2025720 RepID=A0A7W3TL95_9GAMM|nr:DUF3168 domain-containing protein [Lysobacter spongiae]MBB1060427.1 DUF3168 domain-containing protein [Lysobacter spongiae]